MITKAGITHKEQFLDLFMQYEPIRASWSGQRPIKRERLTGFAQTLTQEGRVLLHPAGFIVISFYDCEKPFGYVDHLFVAPEGREKDTARNLIARAEEELRKQGAQAVSCQTHINNGSHNRFYRMLGYEHKGISGDFSEFEKSLLN
jgi:ribosomal protein S18 acetylase RimI-like enzyme